MYGAQTTTTTATQSPEAMVNNNCSAAAKSSFTMFGFYERRPQRICVDTVAQVIC